ncbi:MAG: APC family permease [Chloroflexi bacterium]|nr:APC family permease [Chloroflexota bacterium]
MDDREDKWHRRPGDHIVHRRQPKRDKERGKHAPTTPVEARAEEPITAEAPAEPARDGVHKPGDRLVRFVNLRGARLRRVLGVSGLFSTGYGNVGSSIYYALGVTAMFALGAAPIALTIAGVFFILTVLTYTEATVAVPEAGGASSFSRRGLGEIPSFLAGWVTLLSYTITIAISAYAAGGYLAIFFPVLAVAPYNVIFAVGAIVFLMALNVVGVQEAANFSVIFAVIDLLTQIVLVIVGGIFLLSLPLLIEQIHFGVAPTWSNFFYGITVAMVAYTGIETISNMSEEARTPNRTVPRAYGGLIFAVLVLFTGITTIALSAMPVIQVDGQYTTELATTYLNDPVAGIAHKLPNPYSLVLTPLVGILASSILLIGANAGVIGVSRLSFSMAAHRHLPEFWHKVHPRFRTPYIAIVCFCLIAVLLAMSGSIAQMSQAYVFAATLTFTMAHLALVGMRLREPDLPRPFKLPFNLRVRGREIPITAVVGGLGTFAVLLTIIASYPFGRWIGIGWLSAGIILYVVYRKRAGLPLNEKVMATKGWVIEHREHQEAGRR